MEINELHGNVLQKYITNAKFKKITDYTLNRSKTLVIRSKILSK